MSAMMPEDPMAAGSTDAAAPDAPPPAEPPPDDQAPPAIQARRRAKQASLNFADALTEGLDDMFVAGHLTSSGHGNVLSNLSDLGTRSKRALKSDFKGEIPKLWTVAGDGFLDRMPGCPTDPLVEEVQRHKEEESAIDEELTERLDSVRELMTLLDAPPPSATPALASRRKQAVDPMAQTQLSVPPQRPQQTQVAKPKATPKTPEQEDAFQRQMAEQEQQSKSYEANRQWLGLTQNLEQQLKFIVNQAAPDVDAQVNLDQIGQAYDLITQAVPRDLYTQFLQGRVGEMGRALTVEDVRDRAYNMAYLLTQQLSKVPQGLKVNVDALKQAEQLLYSSIGMKQATRRKRANVAYGPSTLEELLRDLQGNVPILQRDFEALAQSDPASLNQFQSELREAVMAFWEKFHDVDSRAARMVEGLGEGSTDMVRGASRQKHAYIDGAQLFDEIVRVMDRFGVLDRFTEEDLTHLSQVINQVISEVSRIDQQRTGVREAKHTRTKIARCEDCDGFGMSGGSDCATCGGKGSVKKAAFGDDDQDESKKKQDMQDDEPKPGDDQPEDDVSLDLKLPETMDGPDAEPVGDVESALPADVMPTPDADGPMFVLEVDDAGPDLGGPVTDPLDALLSAMPAESGTDDVDDLQQRIDDHVADRERLREMVSDQAQELVEMTRKFRGVEAANRINPMSGDRSFSTYRAWRRSMMQMDPNVRFEGDRNIAYAFSGSREIGHWDGSQGNVAT